jgi:hypothetical protein
MPAYDGWQYDPPAAVAEVVLRDGASGASVAAVLLLIDSGADVTLLPRHAVQSLGLKTSDHPEYELVSFDGSRSNYRAVDLDMVFQSRVFRGRYLIIDGDRGILGRDVLASIAILLDGPRQEWSVVKTQ